MIFFYKRNVCDEDEKNSKLEKLHYNPKIEENKKQLSKVPRVAYNEFENVLDCDPHKRPEIWQYPPNQIDKVRMTYLKWSPYHMDLENYLLSSKYGYPKRFQYTWFSLFSLW